MLDDHSLSVITQFRNSLLTNELRTQRVNTTYTNRGNKLEETNTQFHHVSSKVVEYFGSNYLVFSDETENENASKPKWNRGSSFSDESMYVDDFSGSDGEQERDDQHPLTDIHISEILAPLSHLSEVVSHPSISRTYKSSIYAQLANKLIHTIEVEQNNLNNLTNMLKVCNGEDWFYQLEENMGLPPYDHGLDEEKTKEIAARKHEVENKTRERILKSETIDEITDPFFALPTSLEEYEKRQASSGDDTEFSVAQEELINFLQVSIQRQQEYIRNLIHLRNGLVRADRLKQDILRWGKEMYEKKSS